MIGTNRFVLGTLILFIMLNKLSFSQNIYCGNIESISNLSTSINTKMQMPEKSKSVCLQNLSDKKLLLLRDSLGCELS